MKKLSAILAVCLISLSSLAEQWANPLTGAITNAQPADMKDWFAVVEAEVVPDGYRVDAWNILPVDVTSCRLTIRKKTNLADEAAAAAAAAAKAAAVAALMESWRVADEAESAWLTPLGLALNYGNILTGASVVELPALPAPLPTPQGMAANPRPALKAEWYRAQGWRRVVTIASPDAGNRVATYGVTGIDEMTCNIIVSSQINLAAEAAALATAQSQAVYRASLPISMPTGIEGPVVVLDYTNGVGWGVIADNDGSLLTYQDHASPRPDAATIRQLQAAARTAGATHRQHMQAIRDAIQAVDLSTNGTLYIAITNTTGTTKTALQQVRQTMSDIKAALKSLRDEMK